MPICRDTKSRRGAGMVEYGLLVGLIAVGALVAVQTSGDRASGLLNTVAADLSGVSNTVVNGTDAGAQSGSDEPTAGDGAFLGLADGTLMKIDPDTGAQVWRVPITEGAIRSVAASPGSDVFVSDDADMVYRVNPASGVVRSSFQASSHALQLSTNGARLRAGDTLYNTSDMSVISDNISGYYWLGDTVSASANLYYNGQCRSAGVRLAGVKIIDVSGSCFRRVNVVFHGDVAHVKLWEGYSIVFDDWQFSRWDTTAQTNAPVLDWRKSKRNPGLMTANAEGMFALHSGTLSLFDETGSEEIIAEDLATSADQIEASLDGRVFVHTGDTLEAVTRSGEVAWSIDVDGGTTSIHDVDLTY